MLPTHRAALTFLALLLAAAPAQAQRTLVIERFDAEARVDPSGVVDITETIRPRFTGTWNGIFRTIPVQYQTPQGLNFTLQLDLLSITDDAEHTLRYESSREGHYRKFKIWVPGATDATRVVRLQYRLRNALKFFDEHDELYWNVTGDEWEVPIEVATARVLLPAGVEGLRASAFTGGYGSREQAAQVEAQGTEAVLRTTRPLNFKEGLTVAIGWNPGVIVRPTATDKVMDVVRSNLVLLVPVGIFVLMHRHWRARGRDPRRGPIVGQYEPPAGLTPAELGTLVDNQPDMRDITATLVDLAVRGFVRIEQTEESQLFGLLSSKDYRFVLLRPAAEWDTLAPYERGLLEGIFDTSVSAGESVGLSDLRNKFYKALPGIRDGIFQKLIERGYYVRRPDRVRVFYLVGGAVIGVALAFLGATASSALGTVPGPAVLAGVLSGIIVCAFGWFMPARTAAGAKALDAARGFEEFLERVESDRFARVVKTPEMFEKFLPFAMALQVERNWAKAFEGIYREPPGWYSGNFQTFHSGVFVNDLGRMSTATATSFSSSPRSSGGSGFSGGSSGGGMGGGGGGGF